MSEVIYSPSRTAAASCRQLGYNGLLEATSRFGERDNDAIEINCTSNDTFVRSCDLGIASCNEHVFVSCRSSSVKPFDVRLGNSSVSSRGIIEIRLGGEWRAACVDPLYYRSAYLFNSTCEASCKHFGYGKGTCNFQSLAGRSSCWNIICPNFDCSSIRSIQDFQFFDFGYNIDVHGQFAIEVTCRISDWNVRLVNGFGGTKQSEGRVEVYLNKTWRVVCDSKWNVNDSKIVCRQLGYGDPISRKRRYRAIENDEVIYTNGRRCTGKETALKNCNLQIEQRNVSCQEAVVLCKERKCKANAHLRTFLI